MSILNLQNSFPDEYCIDVIACLNATKEMILHKVQENPQNIYSYQSLITQYRDDKDFLLKLIRFNSDAIIYACTDLKTTFEFILEAIKINSNVFYYLRDEVKNQIILHLLFIKKISKKN